MGIKEGSTPKDSISSSKILANKVNPYNNITCSTLVFYTFLAMSQLFFFALILLFEFSIVHPKETLNSVYLDGEKAFKMYWVYNDGTNTVNFVLEVSTLGWVGFGFANKINRMKNYDVIVGKIENGRGWLTVSSSLYI